MSDTPNKHWLSPYERDDGLTIIRATDQQSYLVIPVNKLAIKACPCCDVPFPTPRAAQAIADIMHPVPATPKPWQSR